MADAARRSGLVVTDVAVPKNAPPTEGCLKRAGSRTRLSDKFGRKFGLNLQDPPPLFSFSPFSLAQASLTLVLTASDIRNVCECFSPLIGSNLPDSTDSSFKFQFACVVHAGVPIRFYTQRIYTTKAQIYLLTSAPHNTARCLHQRTLTPHPPTLLHQLCITHALIFACMPQRRSSFIYLASRTLTK